MSVWAILVAAGRGERLGLDRPKAFAKLGDEPLLAEPLRRLEACPWVDGIVLVAPPGWEEPAILVAEEEGCGKVHACVTGGETRSDSVRAGLGEVPADALVVLVHDAARPLVSDEVVERVTTFVFVDRDLHADALPCLTELRGRGLRLGAAGNMHAHHEEFLRPHVDFVGSSERWGVQKPDAAFFAHVVDEAGVPAEEIL